MTKIKQFIYVCLSAIILSAAHPQVVAAATRLAPVHLYTWARQGNLNRLHQFKRYINLQDANHNTALCIAQQNKDRSAYALLLKFGASTKVACHDDNDPVCAVIAGEKLKVSPAAWWLLGLGAAAGAYKLLDNDGGHKHKRCPTGYSTKYQSVADCGTSGSNGWTYTSLGKYKDLNCGKCTPFQCSQYDDGKGVSNVTECPTYSTLQVAVDTNAIGWAGDKPCYKCTYTCKADLYTSQSSCEEDNDGYSCKSTTENGITCWAPDEPIRCPTGYDTKYQSVEDCGPHGSNGWTYTSSGTSRGLACGKCDPYQCSRYDDGKGVSDVTECPTYSTLQVATDTNAIGWAGETPCYKCTYTCKADYYTSKTLCEEDNDGYTCKSTTENGVTCWAPDEPTSCPTGYSTDYQSVSDCGTSGSNGWSYTSSGVSGNKVCGKCTPYQCSRYDDGKGVSNVTECQTYSTLQVATDTNAIGWAGDTPCYKCTYSCKADYYTSKPLCESDNPGYTCTDTTENGITCWAPNDPAACPIGYSTSIQGLNDCSTTHPEGYTYTSSGTSGGVSCGKCTPKSCRTNYTYSSVTACGTSGSNGWTWTQDTTTPYAGETACGSCTPYQCSRYDDGKGVSNVTECQTYSTLQVATDTNAIGWAGDTPCYKCTYSCKADYYTSKPLCESDNPGYTCTDTTENGITCWAPNDPAACPIGYSTSIQGLNDCSTTHPEGYTYTSSGTSGGVSCGKCTPKSCRTNYTYSSVAACGTSGSNGWTWTQDTTTPYAGETACGSCTPYQCSHYDNGKGVSNVTECQNYSTLQVATDTNAIGWAGDTPCYKCTYSCKADYYTSKPLCESDNPGYTCTDTTENGITCWAPNDPAACPIGYSTSIQGLNDCSTTHPEGYTYTSSGTSGGVSCGKCTPKSCRTNYTYSSVAACGTSGSNGWTWTQDTTTPYAGETACGSCTPYQCSHYDNGKGVSNVTECQNYSTLQAATDTNAIGWAGDTPCYKCTYSCKADYYTSKPLCESDNPGYTCTDTTENGITCWAPGTASSCPTGYSTSYQSVADCGTLNLGSNSWNYTSSGTSGGKLCGMCTPKACPTGYDTQYSDLSKCNRNYNYIEPVDTNQNGHSGDTPCYKCTYVCKSDYRYSSAAACADDWDEPCTPKTENGVTCYVPSSISGASSRRDITIINTNTVNLTSESNEDIYGYTGSMDIENGIDEETGKAGTINITHNSTGNAYGIYGKDGNNIINREGASINIANNNGGNTYGIYSEQGGSVTNEGIIRITGLSGTATGIYGEGGNTIINTESGIIDVSGETAYGIYVKDGTDTRIENAGTIYSQGDNAHGIYVDENSHNATVINTGSIYLNGTDSGDAGITLNGGSIRNTGLMSFSGNADFNAINARFYLEDGGVYEAESLSGDLTVGVSNVLGSNQDTYINENALQAENVEDLNLVSESAMFTASIRSMSSASPASVVLTRRNFEEITPNASVANYMEQNYQDGNLTDMYDDIKAKNTLSAAARASAKQLGYDVLPNFAEENYIALKSLNRNISDNILTPTDETHRVVAGADYINTETDNKGLLSGYELDATSMYTYGDTRLNNNNRLGLGLSITQLRSDYDKGGDRELNIFNLFVPYMHKFTDNLRWASILSVGYGNGEYDRGNDHESDISDIFYGWANELRYTMDLNGFAELEPALMLNTLGYTEEGFDEGHQNGALKSKKTNNLSVEAGFGLFLKKNVSLNNYGKLGFKIGGVHYRELADQYDDIKLRHRGANGWYKVNDYAHIYDNNRTVLEAAIDYEFKRFSMYAKFNQLLQRNDPKLFDLGLKYNF